MREKLHILASGIVISLLFVALYIYKPTFLIFLENKTYDTLLRSTLETDTNTKPVIVDLDEQSLYQYGQWPWPRYRVASLLEKINDLGAASIGLDIIFAEADQTSPKLLQHSISKELQIDFQYNGLPVKYQDNDVLLAEVLAEGPYSLGYNLLSKETKKSERQCLLHPQKVVFSTASGGEKPEDLLYSTIGSACNIDILASAVQSSGFLNALPDIDGVLRRSPLLMRYGAKIYPSLTLAVLSHHTETNYVTVRSNSSGIESIQINDTIIPTDRYGNVLIKYRGKSRTFEYISAGDILNGKVPKEKLENKPVFVGTSAFGLKDLRTTPLDTAFPGVEIHATIVDNILNRDFLSRPNAAIVFEVFSILGWGLLSTVLLMRSKAGWSLFLLAMLSGGMWLGAEWAIVSWGIVVLPTVTILTQFANFSILTLLKFWQEEHKVKQQTEALIQAQNISIRGLATLAETRDPETGAHILRTQHYVKVLAEQLCSHPKFKKFLTGDVIEQLFKMAPLHDIGKVGVPDSILLKPGRLTKDEFEEMKKHTTYGYKTIATVENELGDNSFLQFAKQIIYAHQEKWDGSGYPQGLKGDEIPIPGRLMAVADVYDALISKRVYKEPMPHEEAVAYMLENSGSHFDPDMITAFMEIHESFQSIATQFSDSDVRC